MSNVKMYSFYYRKNKTKKKMWRFLLFLCIIFLVFFCITYAFTLNKNNVYKSKTYYLLSLQNSKQRSYIEGYESRVSAVGGAGLICKIVNEYHIFAFGYFNKEDADKVLINSLSLFEDAQIIELNIPKVKRGKMKSSPLNKIVFEFISNLSKVIYNLIVEVDSRESLYCYRELEKLSGEILENIKILENDKGGDVSDILLISLRVINGLLNNCKDEVYKGANASIKLKTLFLQCAFEEKNLRECLNNA